MVQVDGKPLADRPGLARQYPQASVDAVGGGVQRRRDDHVAAAERALADAVAGEVEGAAVARAAALRDAVLGVQAADADREAGGAGDEVVARGDAAGEHGAGDDGAGARQREAAVDGEAERRAGRPRAALGGGGLEAGAQGGHAGAGGGGYGDDLGAFEAGSDQRVGGLVARGGEAVGVDEVGLGEGDEAAGQAEQVEDRQVLAGLWHRAVVGGDDDEGEVDAAGAGEHVVHQPLVAGHVDEADHAVAGRHVGEAEVDGDAAGLLLLQPVGVDAGQRAHQAGLAVVDVARGADDHRAGSGSGASAARRARAAASGVSASSAGRRNG